MHALDPALYKSQGNRDENVIDATMDRSYGPKISSSPSEVYGRNRESTIVMQEFRFHTPLCEALPSPTRRCSNTVQEFDRSKRMIQIPSWTKKISTRRKASKDVRLGSHMDFDHVLAQPIGHASC
ncbi:unnamed protein product [Lathyrus oleraceus]